MFAVPSRPLAAGVEELVMSKWPTGNAMRKASPCHVTL